MSLVGFAGFKVFTGGNELNIQETGREREGLIYSPTRDSPRTPVLLFLGMSEPELSRETFFIPNFSASKMQVWEADGSSTFVSILPHCFG